MKQPSFYCTHANECPSVCSCDNECYCKSHTCSEQKKNNEVSRWPIGAGPEEWGGSDYDEGFETGWDRRMREDLEYQIASKNMSSVDKQAKVEVSPLVDSRQPSPIPNTNPFIKDLVAKDFADRAEFGKTKYGVYLQADNGRDALKDLYQEQLDAIMYTRLLIFQRDGK